MFPRVSAHGYRGGLAGLVRNRAARDQWSYNFGKYRNIDKDHDGYMIQIVESDARAFENDCLGRNESMGQILNLIDLD